MEKQEKQEKFLSPDAIYEAYRLKKGSLNQEAYISALSRALDLTTKINPIYIEHAKTYSEPFGIELSRETLNIYAILRDNRDMKNEKTDSYMKMGDQPLLAEVL